MGAPAGENRKPRLQSAAGVQVGAGYSAALPDCSAAAISAANSCAAD